MMMEDVTRAGFAALIGEPNAGKSTLLNRLLGARLAIVTHKVQTTRTRIRGVCMVGRSQVVLVDTPGMFRPGRRLERAMVRAAWQGVADADVVVLLIDAKRGLSAGVHEIIAGLHESKARVALAINKIDRVARPHLLQLAEEANAAFPFVRTFMISARRGDGVDDLRAWLGAEMPEHPWFYPEDQLSDLPLRLVAAEMTREKLMLRLHQELPYQLTVETESWQDRADGSTRIEQVIYVMRPGHRGIILGRGGATIKAIGQAARGEIARFIGRPVHLFLDVRVRPDWQEEAARYAGMGLDFRDGDPGAGGTDGG